MAQVNIEIGATDGFRYIGVQPPLTDVQRQLLVDAEYVNVRVPKSFGTRTPDIGESYSETGMVTEAYVSPQAATQATIAVAKNLARLLESTGDLVKVDETIHHIGFGYFLFGGQANRLG